MDFPSHRAIVRNNLREGGRKRPREGDSSATTPPFKVQATVTSSSAAFEDTARRGDVLAEVTVPPQLATPPVIPVVAAGGGEPVDSSVPTSDQAQIGGDLDLELSLRQKRVRDVDAGGVGHSTYISTVEAEEPKVIDTRDNAGEADGFEVFVHVGGGKPRGSTCVDRPPANDNASSSDGGTFDCARSLSNSGNPVGRPDVRIDTNIHCDKVVGSTVILPANQGEILFDSAEAHGLNINVHGLEHDIERRAEDDRPAGTVRPIPQGLNDMTVRDPGESSTSGPQLALVQLGDKILAALDEQRRTLDEQRKMVEQLVVNQEVAGTAAELARGVIFDLQTLMTRSPYRGALNFAFCGLMVAARLGHLTPQILEDPVVQILLGDHIEELRNVINSVVPYQHGFFHGPQ